MRKAQAVYLITLSAAAAAMLARSSFFITQDQWLQLLVLSLIIALSDQLNLTDLSGGALGFGGAGVTVALLVAGPHLAIWATAVGILLANLLQSHYLASLTFNVSQMVVAGWVAFSSYAFLNGASGTAFNHPIHAMVMAGTFMFCNALLFALNLHSLGRMNAWTALRAMLETNSLRAYAIIMLLGIVVGFAYVRGGWIMAAVTVGLAYMLRSTMRRYFAAVKEARSRTQQLEAVLNATQGALVMTDTTGTVKVANRQVGALLGLDPAKVLGQHEYSVPELQEIKSRLPATADEQVQQVIELARGPARFLHWYRTAVHDPQGQLQGHIEVFTDVTALKEAEENLRVLYDSMIRALTAAIDARDSYTHGHSARVSAYAVAIATKMGLPPGDVERIRYSGLVHDIGKLGVDDQVLRKRGALTPEERAMMMRHPVIGAEVLEKANVLTDLIPGVRWHHEWIAGGGYPDGLKGDQIPLDARIICVADALDAMTSDRPYRPALPVGEALRRIRTAAGVQFDPEVAAALIALVDSGELELGKSGGESAHAIPHVDEGTIRPVHSQELAIFRDLAQEDYMGVGMGEGLNRFLKKLYDSVGPNAYLVYLQNPDGTLDLEASIGLMGEESGCVKDLRLVREALTKQASVVVDDLSSLGPSYCPALGAARAEAVIPLVAQDGVYGALVVEAPVAGAFRRDEIYLLEALARRLCNVIKLMRYHERLAFTDTHDLLTGVFNHRCLYERLTEELAKPQPVTVLMLDLDGLKETNERFGYLAGDEALRECGRILQRRVRASDLVARFGGDEFVVLLPGVDREEAGRMAGVLGQELQGHFQFGGEALRLPAISWGVATSPGDGCTAAELLRVAERHLAATKRRRAPGVGLESGAGGL